MHHQFQENQSSRSRRSREKLQRAGEGSAQLRKRTNASKIALDSARDIGATVEENVFPLEFRRSSSNKASKTLIKPPIDEEMSQNLEIRRPSPIVRLMGLDTLPPSPVVPKQPMEMETCFKKISSVDFQEKYATFENYSLRTSTNEHQEFKDVFEVMEKSKVEKHKNQPFRKGMSSLKRSEIDIAFVRHKFMDAKQLSTDEALSKELSDALEVLDSNEDLFLKFLQEPNSLFKKHLQDLKYAPSSPHASHITILKSLKGTKYESSELCCKSEKNVKRCTHIQRGDISSSSKPATGLFCQSLKEHSCSLPPKSMSLYAEKTEACVQPTRIVVLKPSLEKERYTARTVSSATSPENFQFGLGRNREIPLSDILEFYAVGRDREKLSDSVEVMGHKTKGSREIAREITKQMKNTGSRVSKKVEASKFHGYIRDESSCVMSGRANLYSEACRWTSNHFNECNDSFSPSSSYSTESSVSREARKRLLEQWKMTHRFQEVGLGGRGSSTLGEMLALYDRETPMTTLGASIFHKVSDKMARDEALATGGFPLGIRSNDGWKDGCSRNLPRSKSIVASSLVYENSKPHTPNWVGGRDNSYMLKDVLKKTPNDSLDGNLSRRRISSLRNFKWHRNKAQFYYRGEGNKLPEREIHVNSEELRNMIHVRHLAEEERMIPELSDDSVSDRGHLADNFSAPQSNDAKYYLRTNEKQMQQPTALTLLAKDGEPSGHDRNDIEETSIDHPQVGCLRSHCCISESSSPVSPKEADQPSPVSVLEPPSEEEKSSSGCFEKINADLQELRMQLKLLKLDSSDAHAEELEFLISSDEDTGGECHSLLQLGETLEAFRDDEDRDFSFLLDLLIDSGVHGADRDALFNACHSTEYPVAPGVFDKLENKYSVLVSWSRSERKLLFDLINSILADFVTPLMDLSQWVKPRRCRSTSAHEVLVEEVWQMVVRRRKEVSCNLEEKLLEPRWLDFGEDVHMVRGDLERMLNEDLIEELVFELISGSA